ncbi:MAG TPA: universal stress protein [Gemmatimonadales bacterium]|nr:universal stress protein [Gemmatimonadales bacterium]
MASYRLVLVPLDGSAFAEQALPLATEIARRTGAMLQLALVHHPVPALATALEVPQIESQLDQEGRMNESNYLSGVVERVRSTANVAVTSALLDGPVAEALEEQVSEAGADLVVMTTHGRGALSRFWLGSVADHLMRHVHVPVLLIRPSGEAQPVSQLGKILVTLDGSEFSERAIESAVALGEPFDAEYVLLMVLEPPYPVVDPNGLMVVPLDPEAERKLRESAQRYLEGHAARLRQRGLEVGTQVADGLPVARTILAEADRIKADLIAIASHGVGGLERVVVGSVADKVVRGATHPVLVVRPGETP